MTESTRYLLQQLRLDAYNACREVEKQNGIKEFTLACDWTEFYQRGDGRSGYRVGLLVHGDHRPAGVEIPGQVREALRRKGFANVEVIW